MTEQRYDRELLQRLVLEQRISSMWQQQKMEAVAEMPPEHTEELPCLEET